MLTGVENFREMGGLPTVDGRAVRAGRLFRSGHLGAATDDDVARLAELGVTLIVDFRTDEDIEGDGDDRVPDAARHTRLPIGDDSGRTSSIRAMLANGGSLEKAFGGGRARQMVIDGYHRNATAPWCLDAYTTFLAELVANRGAPALWHCSAGKDRAGWASCVVALALGVERDAIIENYLESNAHRRVDEQLAHMEQRGIDSALVRPFIEVRAEYVEASFAGADERWGSTDAYLRDGLRLTDADRDRLRAAYVE